MLATMAMVGNNQILCLMVIGRSLPVVGFAAHDSRHVQLQRLMVTLKV
jgi:hypothetical protein